MCYVQNFDIAVHTISLHSWPRPEDEYVCDSVSYQLSGMAAIGVTESNMQLSSAFLCFIFLSNVSQPLDDETITISCNSFFSHLAQIPVEALLACTSFFSLILGDHSQTAVCALSLTSLGKN